MFKISKQLEIDSIDKKIINILMVNAGLSYQEIGKKLFLSSGAVHVRVKKMETLGIIKNHTATIDFSKIGYDVTCYIGIHLSTDELFESVAAELEKIDEVTSIDFTTGNYSILIKVICIDTHHLRYVLTEKIQKIEGIQRTESHICLHQSINKSLTIIE
jgi:Lrp/AsnC family transcriptional regulator for asnA, asnC and gidA